MSYLTFFSTWPSKIYQHPAEPAVLCIKASWEFKEIVSRYPAHQKLIVMGRSEVLTPTDSFMSIFTHQYLKNTNHSGITSGSSFVLSSLTNTRSEAHRQCVTLIDGLFRQCIFRKSGPSGSPPDLITFPPCLLSLYLW
jgi:hypothetical protein